MKWIAEYFDFPDADERGEIIGTKKGRTWRLCFTDDEKDRLREYLAHYDPRQVDRFLNLLRRQCEYYARFLSQKEAAKRRQNAVKKTLSGLEGLEIGLLSTSLKINGLPTPQGYIKAVPSNEASPSDFFTGVPQYVEALSLVHRIQDASKQLIGVLRQISENERSTWDKKMTRGDFALAVDAAFEETFNDKPSMAANAVFDSILKTCLDGIKGGEALDTKRHRNDVASRRRT